jgi:DNA adenine methylase
MAEMEVVKPPMKWVGGKSQILEKILSSFPAKIKHYYEPFLGGGSVLIGLLCYVKAGRIDVQGDIHAFDINENIIWLYKNLQTNLDAIMRDLETFCNEYKACPTEGEVHRRPSSSTEALTCKESYYYWVRSKYNAQGKQERSSPKSSAMMLFLNKTCFRGLYREGPNGFNVPYGNYKNPTIYDENHLRKISQLIQPVLFEHCGFQYSLMKPSHGDFVYLDPPYAPENSKSFVGYNPQGFTLQDHQALFSLCNKLDRDGVGVMLSNADVDIITSSFAAPRFHKRVITCKRAINAKNPGATTNEVLVCNTSTLSGTHNVQEV